MAKRRIRGTYGGGGVVGCPKLAIFQIFARFCAVLELPAVWLNRVNWGLWGIAVIVLLSYPCTKNQAFHYKACLLFLCFVPCAKRTDVTSQK